MMKVKQLGILGKQEALQIAQERELDLVEISPDANPPVCKIVDWVSSITSAQAVAKEPQDY